MRTGRSPSSWRRPWGCEVEPTPTPREIMDEDRAPHADLRGRQLRPARCRRPCWQRPVNDGRARRASPIMTRRWLRARQGQVRRDGLRAEPTSGTRPRALPAAARPRAALLEPVQRRRAVDPPHLPTSCGHQGRPASKSHPTDAENRGRQVGSTGSASPSRAGETDAARHLSPSRVAPGGRRTPRSTTPRRRPTSSPPTSRYWATNCPEYKANRGAGHPLQRPQLTGRRKHEASHGPPGLLRPKCRGQRRRHGARRMRRAHHSKKLADDGQPDRAQPDPRAPIRWPPMIADHIQGVLEPPHDPADHPGAQRDWLGTAGPGWPTPRSRRLVSQSAPCAPDAAKPHSFTEALCRWSPRRPA